MDYCEDCVKKDRCPVFLHDYTVVYNAYEQLASEFQDSLGFRPVFTVALDTCPNKIVNDNQIKYELHCGTLYLEEIKEVIENEVGLSWNRVKDDVDIEKICGRFNDAMMEGSGWKIGLETVIRDYFTELENEIFEGH